MGGAFCCAQPDCFEPIRSEHSSKKKVSPPFIPFSHLAIMHYDYVAGLIAVDQSWTLSITKKIRILSDLSPPLN